MFWPCHTGFDHPLALLLSGFCCLGPQQLIIEVIILYFVTRRLTAGMAKEEVLRWPVLGLGLPRAEGCAGGLVAEGRSGGANPAAPAA